MDLIERIIVAVIDGDTLDVDVGRVAFNNQYRYSD
jgi:hypothetical protein